MRRREHEGHVKKQHRLTRARLLKSGLIVLTVAAGLAASLGGRAKAATNDPVLSGNSGNAGNPNLAEDATEVQYDGGGAPGVVFLAQADGTWSPSAAAYPAAIAGWTTTSISAPCSERTGFVLASLAPQIALKHQQVDRID